MKKLRIIPIMIIIIFSLTSCTNAHNQYQSMILELNKTVNSLNEHLMELKDRNVHLNNEYYMKDKTSTKNNLTKYVCSYSDSFSLKEKIVLNNKYYIMITDANEQSTIHPISKSQYSVLEVSKSYRLTFDGVLTIHDSVVHDHLYSKEIINKLRLVNITEQETEQVSSTLQCKGTDE